MPPTKPTDSTKDAVVNAMMKFWEKDRWMSVRSVFQLRNEEAADRLAALLAMHLLLDRAVTELLSRRLLDPRMSQSLEDVEDVVSDIGFFKRVMMAEKAHLISDSCAADLKAVNKVRNKFAHCQPKDSKGRESVVPEVASPQDFDRYIGISVYGEGERAFAELNGILIEQVVEPSTLVDPPTTSQ